MTKTTGAEWKRFYDDKDYWQPGVYHEDEEITVDGKPVDTVEVDLGEVADTSVMTVRGGDVKMDDGTSVRSLEAHFKLWLKGQTIRVFAVEVPVAKEAEIQAVIRRAGGKVL